MLTLFIITQKLDKLNHLRMYLRMNATSENIKLVGEYIRPLHRICGITYIKVPPSGKRRGQKIERHVICKAPERDPGISFRRLANRMPFSSLTATLSARWVILG